MKRCLGNATGLVVMALLCGFIGNLLSPRGLPLRTPAPKPLPTDQLITLAEAESLWSSGAAFFLDARQPADYAAGHIAGAFNLPPLMFEEHFQRVAPYLTPDTRIIIYCDGVECDLSHRLSERLKPLGFPKIQILSNGWTLWHARGLAVESKSQP